MGIGAETSIPYCGINSMPKGTKSRSREAVESPIERLLTRKSLVKTALGLAFIAIDARHNASRDAFF
jgi:hypothetical protein